MTVSRDKLITAFTRFMNDQIELETSIACGEMAHVTASAARAAAATRADAYVNALRLFRVSQADDPMAELDRVAREESERDFPADPNARYAMYTPEGNAALAAASAEVCARIRRGSVRPGGGVYDAVTQLRRKLISAGYGEVLDTEPEIALIRDVRKACVDGGYAFPKELEF